MVCLTSIEPSLGSGTRVIDDNTLWKDIIRLTYVAKEGGWFSQDPRSSYGVGLWKGIRKEAA